MFTQTPLRQIKLGHYEILDGDRLHFFMYVFNNNHTIRPCYLMTVCQVGLSADCSISSFLMHISLYQQLMRILPRRVSQAVLLLFTVLMIMEEIPDLRKLWLRLCSASPRRNTMQWRIFSRYSFWQKIQEAKYDILVLGLDTTAVRPVGSSLE
jgi:hypothetical protein